MGFLIGTYLGDYPVDNQPNWQRPFYDRQAAIHAARKQHAQMQERYKFSPHLSTIIIEAEEHVTGDEAALWFRNGEKELTGAEAEAAAQKFINEGT